MASTLLEELKNVATEVKRSQIEDVMGTWWDLQGRGKGPSRDRGRDGASTGRRAEGGGQC